MKKRRPPRLVEWIVYWTAPFDRRDHVWDLRCNYRRRLRRNGEREARRYAYREAFHGVWSWMSVIVDILIRIGFGK